MEHLYDACHKHASLYLIGDAMASPDFDFDDSFVKEQLYVYFEKCMLEDEKVLFDVVISDDRVDINYTQQLTGNGLLHIVCIYRCVWALELLLKQTKLDVNLKATNTNMTGLMFAVQFDDYDMTNLFIKDPRVDVDIVMSHSCGTALEQAIHNQHWDLIELLLLRQPNVKLAHKQQCPLLAKYWNDPITTINDIRVKHQLPQQSPQQSTAATTTKITDAPTEIDKQVITSTPIVNVGDMSVIKDASYVVYDEIHNPNYNKVSCNSKWATFYTYDGEFIIRVKHNLCDMTQRLDSLAPKPHVLKVQKLHISTSQQDNTYILFIDDNHNIIGSEIYYQLTNVATISDNDNNSDSADGPGPECLELYKSKYDLTDVVLSAWNVEGKPVERRKIITNNKPTVLPYRRTCAVM